MAAPVQKVVKYETPDGEQHDTYEEALEHYREVSVFKELVECLEQVLVNQSAEEALDVAECLSQEWRKVIGVLVRYYALEGLDGAVPDELLPLLDAPLSAFNWTMRCQNLFISSDMQYLGELVRLTEEQWLARKNVGHKALAETTARLADFNLEHGMATHNWTPPNGKKLPPADIEPELPDEVAKAAKKAKAEKACEDDDPAF